MTEQLVIIANPRAGRGRAGHRLRQVAARLNAKGCDTRILETARRGHAEILAGEALDAGNRLIVAAGGDGTVHEVVNALAERPNRMGEAEIALLPIGSGCDFARMFSIPSIPLEQVEYLIGGNTRSIDLARIDFETPHGSRIRHFVNIAEIGLGGDNVRRADGLPRWLGGSRYAIAFWITLARYRPQSISVHAGHDHFEGRCLTVTVANGQFFGGGMWISPHSDPGDGVLDVQISTGQKRQAVTVIPKVYRGTHLPDRNIMQTAAAAIHVDAEFPAPIEADGEVLGTTPADISVVAGAVRLRVPQGV